MEETVETVQKDDNKSSGFVWDHICQEDPNLTFETLLENKHPDLLQILKSKGFTNPSAIQRTAIPLGLNG